MSKTTLSLVPLFLGLLSVSSHGAGAGEEPSRFDGRWQVWYTASRSKSYRMEFSGGRFHAVDGEQWYKGEIVIDAGTDPARIDFTIRECDCTLVGKTSEAIFRWDGEALEIRAPSPGDPRPTAFDEKSGETMRLVREKRDERSP